MKLFFLTLILLTFAPIAGAIEATKTANPGVRKTVWSFGLSGIRHSLKAGDGNEVLGNSASINLGTGYVSDSWYILGSFDIILGPYEPTYNQQLDVDYFGTGFTVWSGYSAQELNLRSPDGGYGFALGFSYADIVGRSIGKNRGESASNIDNNNLVDNYTIKVTNFSLLPAVFFSWLEEPRSRGNSPDLLKTRIDGYFLTIGIAMPLLISYHAKFDTRDQYEVVDDKVVIIQESETERPSGHLRGYSLLITMTSLLGS
jgi:hypothetical protein